MSHAWLIQPIMWILAGGAAIVFAALAVRRRRNEIPVKRLWYYAAGAGVAALMVVPAIGVVPAGHRGAVYEWGGGVNPRERGEGITLLLPWVQTMTNVSVRTQKVFSSKVFAQSLDLQEITVVASVNYHVEPDRAAELYQEVGPQYRSTVIQPALFQRTKAAIGRVRAEDFALSRSSLAETIRHQLTEQLSPYGIAVEFVNIEDAIFDPAFVAAVKAKVIAEQAAKEQKNLIAARAAVKRQTIIDAEANARKIRIEASAQAKANILLARSLTPNLLRWRWLVGWNGALPSTLVAGKDATLLLGIGAGASTVYPSYP